MYVLHSLPFVVAGASHLQVLVFWSHIAPATHVAELVHAWFTAFSETRRLAFKAGNVPFSLIGTISSEDKNRSFVVVLFLKGENLLN